MYNKGCSRIQAGISASNMSMHGSSDSRSESKLDSKRIGSNTLGLEENMETYPDDGKEI